MFSMLDNETTERHWLRRLLQSNACAVSVEASCNDPGLAQTWAIIALFLIFVGGATGEDLQKWRHGPIPLSEPMRKLHCLA